MYARLTSPESLDEVAFSAVDSATGRSRDVKVGEKVRTTDNNRVPLRPRSNDRYQCTATRAHQWMSDTRIGVTSMTEESVYGFSVVKGKNLMWKIDHNTPREIAFDHRGLNELLSVDGEIHGLSNDEKRLMTVFPFVIAQSWNDAEMDENNLGDNATVDDYIRYDEQFYYKFIKPLDADTDIAVKISGADLEIPDLTGASIASTPENAKGLPAAYFQPSFDWGKAKAGEYVLPFAANTKTERDIYGSEHTYDFNADIISLGFLDCITVTPELMTVCSDFKGYIESFVRKNPDYTGENLCDYAIAKGMRAWTRNANAFLMGVPSGGKTTLARAFAAIFGLPCCVFNLDENAEKDVLTRETIVGKDGLTGQYSPFYWYVKYGGIFVFDDASNARQNMMFATIGSVLEAPFALRMTECVVPRHPMCFIMATANVGTEGSHSMQEAMSGRWGIVRNVKAQEDSAFIETMITVASQNTGLPATDKIRKLAEWIYNKIHKPVYKLVATADKEIAGNLVTLRQATMVLETAMNTLAVGGKPEIKEQAKDAYGNLLALCGNEALAEDVRLNIQNAAAPRI